MVVPGQPALGVCRLERLLAASGARGARARLFLYDEGRFVVVPLSEVIPAPPGVWDRAGGAGGAH